MVGRVLRLRNRSEPRRSSSKNAVRARTRKEVRRRRSLESNVAAAVVNATGVSRVTPTSGVKNSGIIRGSIPVVRDMSRYESVWNKGLRICSSRTKFNRNAC